MKHMFYRREHMPSDRRLDDDGLVQAERVPDAVEKQIRIVAEGRPLQHDFFFAVPNGFDELWKLDFQEFNDVRRHRPHDRIVSHRSPKFKSLAGIASPSASLECGRR